MQKIFETERLIIRQWEKKDFKDLYDYASQDEVTKFLSWETYKEEQTAIDRIDYLLESYKEAKIDNDFAVELKSENKVIGSLAFMSYNSKNEGSLEVGYVLNTKYQGFGYMTEALSGAFKYIKSNNM